MGRTVLIGHPSASWREWEHDTGTGMVCLDPLSADHGPAARAHATVGGRPKAWSFIGSLDSGRQPVRVLEAAAQLTWQLPDAVVEVQAPRALPFARQFAMAVCRVLRPERILVPEGSGMETWGWPIGAEPVPCPAPLPSMVCEAQRRSRWIEMIEGSVEHVVDLGDVQVEGARLGSGRRIDLDGWDGWAEHLGTTLLIVGDLEPSPRDVSRWLDYVHGQKIVHVRPQEYEGILCSFAGQEGEDFGIGTVTRFLAADGVLVVQATAVAPAPVRILKLGTLRLTPNGREAGEAKPWSL